MNFAHDSQLQGLKQQIDSLKDGLLPRVAGLRDQARPPLERLMRYAEMAADYAPEVSAVMERYLPAASLERRGGLMAKVARHRVLLTGLAIGAGLFAYDIWGDKLAKLARDHLPQA